MDEALRRTRRNMIGVSIALFLSYLFNWSFPNDLRLLNYDVPLSASDLEWFAWIFLIYLCVEYWIHVRSKFPEILTAYRKHLERQLEPYVEQNLIDSDRKRISDYLKQQNDFKLKKVRVDFQSLAAGKLNVRVDPVFTIGPGHERTSTTKVGITQSIEYSSILSYRIRAGFLTATIEGVGFEYIIPVLYPTCALILMISRKTLCLVDFGRLTCAF